MAKKRKALKKGKRLSSAKTLTHVLSQRKSGGDPISNQPFLGFKF